MNTEDRSRKRLRERETILFAVCGMSPAVLTETVWALAHERPATVPDRVVVLTTLAGRARIKAELLDGGVWAALRGALKADDHLEFGDTGAHIRVITRGDRELDDIRSPEDNAAAADFILAELRTFVENPDARVVATIAGGRKTMSALLYAAMSLLGRETDRITHVLVHDRLETRGFYFPRTATEARCIELADLPFVPLRNRFVELGQMPGSFSRLVARYSRQLKADATRKSAVRLTDEGVTVNGAPVPLRRRAALVLGFLLDLNRKAKVPEQAEAEVEFRGFVAGRDADWAANLVYPEDLKRELSYLRTALTTAGLSWMPGLRRHSLRLPPYR